MEFEASLEQLIQKWTDLAASEVPLALKLPLRNYLDEATELAALCDQYLEPSQHGSTNYPGLSTVFDGQILTWETPTELRELVLVIGELQARGQSATPRASSEAPARAKDLKRDWFSILDYVFLTAKDASSHKDLVELRKNHKSADLATLHNVLVELHVLAESNKDRIFSVGKTESDLAQLRDMSAQLLLHERNMQAHAAALQEATRRRNQLLQLLEQRVVALRRAFRFVFRNHPDVVERSQSSYARRRRRKHAAKRKLAEKG